MKSKNPIKGYIKCHLPDCEHIATVHAVGEHKVEETGEAPKNIRNLGRLYYNCPEHGFQQGKGAQFQAYITANMATDKADLKGEIVKPPSQTEQGLKPETKPDDKPKTSRRINTTALSITGAFVLMGLIALFSRNKGSQNHGTTAAA